MDMKTGTAMLDTLVFAIQQAVKLQDENAILILIEFFEVVLAQGREFALQVLEHLREFFQR